MNLRVSDAVDGEEVMVAVSGRVNEVTATAAKTKNSTLFEVSNVERIIVEFLAYGYDGGGSPNFRMMDGEQMDLINPLPSPRPEVKLFRRPALISL